MCMYVCMYIVCLYVCVVLLLLLSLADYAGSRRGEGRGCGLFRPPQAAEVWEPEYTPSLGLTESACCVGRDAGETGGASGPSARRHGCVTGLPHLLPLHVSELC